MNLLLLRLDDVVEPQLGVVEKRGEMWSGGWRWREDKYMRGK